MLNSRLSDAKLSQTYIEMFLIAQSFIGSYKYQIYLGITYTLVDQI